MKWVTITLFIFFLVLPNTSFAQSRSQKKAIDASIKYYAKHTKNLPVIDKIALFRIKRDIYDFSEIDKHDPNVIRTGRGHKEIIATKLLKNTQAKELAAIWRKLQSGNGAGCFSPGYLIRFYNHNKFIFESEICFHCCNITLPNGYIYSMCGDTKVTELLKEKLAEITKVEE